MMASNTRATRSRYSSPANQQRSGGNGASNEMPRSSTREGSRAVMERWLEPPVQSKASFEEAGLMRFGVVETMAPLGILPKPKKNDGGPGVRKIILRPSGFSAAATSAAAAAAAAASADTASKLELSSTPKAPIATTKTTTTSSSSSSPTPLPPPPPLLPASQPLSPTQPVSRAAPRKSLPAATTIATAVTPTKDLDFTKNTAIGMDVDEDEEYDPKRPPSRRRHSGKPSLPKKGRPPASVRRSSFVPSTLPSPEKMVRPVSAASSQPEPRERAPDFLDRVVEAAVVEALHHYRYPTAYALRTLYNENSHDAVFVSMIESVFNQTADDETKRKFTGLLEQRKRVGKTNNRGLYYFVPPTAESPSSTPHKPVAAPYSHFIQRPAAEGQGRGEMRPTKKIKLIHSGGANNTNGGMLRKANAPIDADADADSPTAAVAAAGFSASKGSTELTSAGEITTGMAGSHRVKTPSSRKRARRHSGSSDSSLSSVMSLSSPEVKHGSLMSPSVRRGAKLKAKAKEEAEAETGDGITAVGTGATVSSTSTSTNSSNANANPTANANANRVANSRPQSLQTQTNGSAPDTRPITMLDKTLSSSQELSNAAIGSESPTRSSSPAAAASANAAAASNNHHQSESQSQSRPHSHSHPHPHSHSPSQSPLFPPASPSTAIVEDRQEKKKKKKKQKSKKQQGDAAAPAPKSNTKPSPALSRPVSRSKSVADGDDADADADASMPGRLNAVEPAPRTKSAPSTAALKRSSSSTPIDPDEAQEAWERRLDAKKVTNGFTATESSIRDGSGDRDVTPSRPTRRATRQSLMAPLSTRSTRSANKRAHDEGDTVASPSVLSFQGVEPSSVAGSRAVTPTNLRPAKKAKTGGLRVKLSPVKKKGGTAAGVPRSMGEAQASTTNGAAKDQISENDESCSACGNAGDVVCCDGCPRSFHFECVDMDRDDLPDEWYCYQCLVKKYPSRVPVHKGIFGAALNSFEKSNPRAFSLPKKLQNRFEGVKAGADGDYEEVNPNKASTKKKNGGYEEAPDFFKQREDGDAVLCHDCQKAATDVRAIIPCSVCPLHWHTDCLNPPLAIPPPLKTWRCPAHADDTLLEAPPLAPAHRFRKIKNADSITPVIGRGLKNNGHIEVDWADEMETMDNSGWRDSASFGRTYKIPAKGVILDFIEQMRKQGAGHGPPTNRSRRMEPYLTPPVEDRDRDQDKDHDTSFASATVERSVEELQASLILSSLSQAPTNGVEQLTSALLASADPTIVSLIAQGNAESIARDQLADTDKQSLRALLAQMDVMSSNIRNILGEQHKPTPERGAFIKEDGNDTDKMDVEPLVTEPTPPSTIDHAESAMDFD